MAKPPTCRKCGNPHWTTEQCPRVETPESESDLQSYMRGGWLPYVPPKPKRDRTAYMREFMRKRRAKP